MRFLSSLIITKTQSVKSIFLGCHWKMHSEIVSHYYYKAYYLKNKPLYGTWMEIMV